MQPSRGVKQYYDTRAPEYDEWYLDLGKFTTRERPGWHEEVAVVELVVAGLAPARTLDIACGTGFLTRHLRGERVPGATLIRGDALELPSAPEHEREEWQERVLNEGDWFVAVSSIGRARAIPAQLSGPERACLRAGS